MTPQQQEQFNTALTQIAELYAWMKQHEIPQLGGVSAFGSGASALTQTYTDSHGDTLSGPKAYAGTEILLIKGTQREIPYL